jgi:hypothetical protein
MFQAANNEPKGTTNFKQMQNHQTTANETRFRFAKQRKPGLKTFDDS